MKWIWDISIGRWVCIFAVHWVFVRLFGACGECVFGVHMCIPVYSRAMAVGKDVCWSYVFVFFSRGSKAYMFWVPSMCVFDGERGFCAYTGEWEDCVYVWEVCDKVIC